MKALRHAIVLDDHKLFADAFSLLLEKYQLFDLVQTFNTVDELMNSLLKTGNQEIHLFLDYHLNDENGLSILSEVRRLNKLIKIIFVTSANSPSVLMNIQQYNPQAMLSKSCSLDIIKTCLNEIANNNFYVDPHMLPYMQQSTQVITYTPREIELLRHFSNGSSIAETAEKTFLSPHTIVAHRRKMMAKANCNSIGQLLKFVKDHEII